MPVVLPQVLPAAEGLIHSAAGKKEQPVALLQFFSVGRPERFAVLGFQFGDIAGESLYDFARPVDAAFRIGDLLFQRSDQLPPLPDLLF